MASKEQPVDVVTAVFPLNLEIGGKQYKILTKTSDVKFIADSKYNFSVLKVDILEIFCNRPIDRMAPKFMRIKQTGHVVCWSVRRSPSITLCNG